MKILKRIAIVLLIIVLIIIGIIIAFFISRLEGINATITDINEYISNNDDVIITDVGNNIKCMTRVKDNMVIDNTVERLESTKHTTIYVDVSGSDYVLEEDKHILYLNNSYKRIEPSELKIGDKIYILKLNWIEILLGTTPPTIRNILLVKKIN